LDKPNLNKFPSVVRFVETVLRQPQIAEFWTVEWPEKVAIYTPPAKEPKKKEDKKASEQPKKQEKQKPKQKEPEPEEEEEDLVPKEEPKPKHPLESLPKSAFNLEDWKRAYSNKDTRGPGGSIEWFNEKCVEKNPRVRENTDCTSASIRKDSPCGDATSSTIKN
jgi:elongation factor 1-gamma